jgi:hypothetical protein
MQIRLNCECPLYIASSAGRHGIAQRHLLRGLHIIFAHVRSVLKTPLRLDWRALRLWPPFGGAPGKDG